MQRQHRVTEDALKSLKKALSISVEDYPHLKEKDALVKHFVYIQKIVESNPELVRLKADIVAHIEQMDLINFKIQEKLNKNSIKTCNLEEFTKKKQ